MQSAATVCARARWEGAISCSAGYRGAGARPGCRGWDRRAQAAGRSRGARGRARSRAGGRKEAWVGGAPSGGGGGAPGTKPKHNQHARAPRPRPGGPRPAPCTKQKHKLHTRAAGRAVGARRGASVGQVLLQLAERLDALLLGLVRGRLGRSGEAARGRVSQQTSAAAHIQGARSPGAQGARGAPRRSHRLTSTTCLTSGM
jgi:hypothetical protein